MVCNSGTSLVPTVDGATHHFENVGLYDGVFVLQDVESRTLWNHITGEALYGPHVGSSLGPIENMLQMTVEQALANDPATQVAISDRPYAATGRVSSRWSPDSRDVQMASYFVETLGAEDDRLPRMTMGLGLVTESTVRFYPMDLIEERGAIIDQVDDRPVLVFVDPTTFTPAALFVDATSAEFVEREVRLDTGWVVQRGVLLDGDRNRVDAERPQQLFSRWYGFALTFPQPEIFSR